jgi:hypothetical protein
MAKSETIKIQDGDQVIELTGEAKDAFIADREAINVQFQLVEAEQIAKQEARASAITKLAEIAGLTEEEINSIL